MTKAYNDSAGYTREFNLNLLKRMNSELGANFNIDKFAHHGFYNPVRGAMESCLISTETQDVYFSTLNLSFHFDSFEPLHLEYSFKYTVEDIKNLSSITGFDVEEFYFDDKKMFVNSLWKTHKEC